MDGRTDSTGYRTERDGAGERPDSTGVSSPRTADSEGLAVRAVSTVLDTGLFLLLVGAAMLTLAVPPGPLPFADADAADPTADVLATSTADVQYSLAPGAQQADDELVSFPRADGPEFDRTAHGTLADHLGTVTVGTLTVDGQRVTHTGDGFRVAVANATRTALRGRDHLAQVRVVWEPYPDAPIRGEVTVGPSPPPAMTVHTATLAVDSGLPAARQRARTAAAPGSYGSVAETVATRIVDGLFPPEAAEDALLGDYPVDRLGAYRYRRMGQLFGANVTTAVRANNVDRANAALTDALAAQLAADMRTRFESPAAAAEQVRVGTVRLTIRTWSP